VDSEGPVDPRLPGFEVHVLEFPSQGMSSQIFNGVEAGSGVIIHPSLMLYGSIFSK
jgi:hypothetical protein